MQMQKEQIIQAIRDNGLVAVVCAESSEHAIRITEACIAGGVAAIELTFTVPFAHQVIETLAKRYDGGEILLGAGTVLDAETARIAMLSGSQFIVSPYFREDLVRFCNRYRCPVMPGVMTVTEAVQAMEAGTDILKVFPGELCGPVSSRPFAALCPMRRSCLPAASVWRTPAIGSGRAPAAP